MPRDGVNANAICLHAAHSTPILETESMMLQIALEESKRCEHVMLSLES